MSGGLLVNALLRETNHRLTPEEVSRLQRVHADAYKRQVKPVRALPGARDLVNYLSEMRVPYAIATSGRQELAHLTVQMLDLDPQVPIITRDQVRHAKPGPALFLAAANSVGVRIESAVVVGDSV